MEEKFCVLNLIQGDSIELANVRSLLSGLFYIEIDNNFYISCSKSFKDSFDKSLKQKNINYILVFVDSKFGCDVFSKGISESDTKKIEDIIMDKNA